MSGPLGQAVAAIDLAGGGFDGLQQGQEIVGRSRSMALAAPLRSGSVEAAATKATEPGPS